MFYSFKTLWLFHSLCFACGDGFASLCLPVGVRGSCAVGLWRGLCAADGGNDGFGRCKAHGCGLLVKTSFSDRPFLCFHDAGVCCHNSGLEMLRYCY